MFGDKALRKQIKELSFALVAYKDLYIQASDNRDFWKNQAQKASDSIRIIQNKLRDEKEFCDQLVDFLDAMLNNHNTLTDADIRRGKLLIKLHKESRNVK